MPDETTVTLIANTPIKYAGKRREEGEPFDCDPETAAKLIDAGAAHGSANAAGAGSAGAASASEATNNTAENAGDDAHRSATPDPLQAESGTHPVPGDDAAGAGSGTSSRVVTQIPSAGPPTDPKAREQAIRDAIGGLDKNDTAHWTKSGAPDATVLTEKLGWAVSAKERDAVWAGMQPPAGE